MIYDNESIMINESNAMEVVNEAYFGKTKDVLAIEQAVHDLRKPYVQKGINQNFNINTYLPTIESDPNLGKLCDVISDAFGFGDTMMTISGGATISIGTMSNSMCIDLSSGKLKRDLRSSKNGFKYDKKSDILFVMNMPAGVLVSEDFTDAELTAAILHEVGHNFSPAISRGMAAYNAIPIVPYISLIVSEIANLFIPDIDANRGIDSTEKTIGSIAGVAATGIINSNKGHRIMKDFDAELRKIVEKVNKKCPWLVKSYGLAKGGTALAMSILQSYGKSLICLLLTYPLAPITIAKTLADRIAKPFGYEDEKFADAFAASYGYGEDLASFLNKTNSYQNDFGDYIYDYIPLASALKEVYMLPLTIVLNAIDEHPNNAARAKSTVKQLQREITTNKTISSSTKKKLQEQINNIEKIYDIHENSMKGLPKGSDVKLLYQKIMYNLIDGDIHGKFSATHVSDDIDAAYAATRESIDVYDNKERIGMIKENTDMMKNKFKDLMNF